MGRQTLNKCDIGTGLRFRETNLKYSPVNLEDSFITVERTTMDSKPREGHHERFRSEMEKKLNYDYISKRF